MNAGALRWILITGLPATGKTTVAKMLAARYGMPLLAKDAFKEKLLDAHGAVDASGSRELSNRSFEALFAALATCAAGGRDVLLEGNFRAGEHEAMLRNWPQASIAQVLCRCDESRRLARIAARAADATRHPGHGDARAVRDASNDTFLDVPGERFLLRTDDDGAVDTATLLAVTDHWWWTPPRARSCPPR